MQTLECEYKLLCGFADENACKYEGCYQDCALWRDFSVKEKVRKAHSRLNAVGSEKCQANVQEIVLINMVNALGMLQKALSKKEGV